MFFSNILVEDGQEVEHKWVEYSDVQLAPIINVPIINDCVFLMFVLYFIVLNFGLLVLLPAYTKTPISIYDIRKNN